MTMKFNKYGWGTEKPKCYSNHDWTNLYVVRNNSGNKTNDVYCPMCKREWTVVGNLNPQKAGK